MALASATVLPSAMEKGFSLLIRGTVILEGEKEWELAKRNISEGGVSIQYTGKEGKSWGERGVRCDEDGEMVELALSLEMQW